MIAAAALLLPELFGAGVISTSLDEFGGAITNDGKEFYFSISIPRFLMEVICVSKQKHGRWSEPKVVPWSGIHHDFDPCLSPDGKTMFFISDRPVHGEKKTDYDVWMLRRQASGWGVPIHLPAPVNSEGSEHFASPAANGDLYVCSDRDGVSSKVYRVPFVNGRYGAAEALPAEVNGEGWTLESSISPDGKVLVSAIVGRHDSLGLYDLYISFKTPTGWTPAQNMGPEINSSARDYTPRITADGKWLYYSSEKGFAQVRRSSPFTMPELDRGADSLMNGYGNIYRVPMASVLARFGR
jgi:Tol biopolymer transport system component